MKKIWVNGVVGLPCTTNLQVLGCIPKTPVSRLMMSNEIEITVLVSYQSKGETINQVVPFRVLQEGSNYKAIPLLHQAERKQTNLPEALYFDFINHTIIPGKGIDSDSLDLVKMIIREIQIQESFR